MFFHFASINFFFTFPGTKMYPILCFALPLNISSSNRKTPINELDFSIKYSNYCWLFVLKDK